MYLPLSILEVSETFAWDNDLSNFKNVGIFTEQLKIVQPQIAIYVSKPKIKPIH